MAKRLIVAILTVACWLAVAHPMGNFSVSHYARFDLKPGAVDLVYVLDLAELPTFDLLRGWGLERTSPKAQLERKAAEQAREWAKHLDIASDGRAVEPKFVRAEIALSDGAGNLPVMRVTSHLRLPVLAGKLTYEDRNFPDRAGWKEIVIGAGEGSTVLTASQGAVDRSKALVEYPQDPTVAPPQDVRASMEWKGAPTAPVAVVAAVEKPAPVIVPVPQPKAPAAVAPATMTTQAAPPGAMVKGDFLSRLLHQRELSFGMILIAIAAAFGLGAAHALTPGHGKTIVAAYLVGSRGTLKHAAFLGAMVTFTHTVSVFLLGLATLFLFQYIVPEKITQWLGVISGLSIVGIGGWMLFTRLRGAQVDAHVMGHDGDHGHPHDHSHADAHDLMHAHAYAIGVAGADAQVHSHASVDEPKLAHLHIAARADAHSSDHSHPHAHEPVHSHSQLAGVASPDAHGHSHGHSHPHPHEPVHVHSQPSGVMSLEIHDHSHEHSHPHSHEPVHVHSQPDGMASLESHDNSHGHSHPHEPVHSHSELAGAASPDAHDHSHGHSHPHAHEPVHVHSQLAGTATHDAHDLSHAHPHPHAHSHPNAVGVASHAHGHGHGHDHAHPHPHTHGSLAHSHGPGGQVHSHDVPDTITWGSLTALAISGGLVPCESALLLLLSAIALGRVGLGLLLLIAFSLGLAVVLMGIGVLVIYAKDLFPERDKSKPRNPVFRWIPVASAAVVMVIGILMTGVSLGWIQAKWMV